MFIAMSMQLCTCATTVSFLGGVHVVRAHYTSGHETSPDAM